MNWLYSNTLNKIIFLLLFSCIFFSKSIYVTPYSYSGLKIAEGHMCLWCNETGKMFQSILAAQRHMVDKGHCKILHDGDTLIEFADFYDYRSSYPGLFFL